MTETELNERSLMVMELVGGLLCVFMPRALIDIIHDAHSDYLKMVGITDPPGLARRIAVRGLVLIIGFSY